MRLSVSHRTHYRFDPPRRALVQSHRLTPSAYEGQQVIWWDVKVPGALKGACFRDGAGDWIETVSMLGPVEEVAIEVTGEVETRDLSGVLRGHRETAPPPAYLRTTWATRPDSALRDLSSEAVSGAADALDRAHRLAAAVRGAIDYVPGATDSATTAAEALEQGQGVCQDHAHALIAAAIAADIPARYVAGYLFVEGEAMGEASHAWAELHVPALGWVGFDAANGCCPDARYIRLGSGHDAVLAAPIRGLVDGTGDETLEVAVRVVNGQWQEQQQ